MIKSIFCLSFIFAVATLGFAAPDIQKEPEKVEESSGSMILVPPFFYSDDDSFYTLLFGWKNDKFCYVVPPLYVGIDLKRSFDSYFIFPIVNLRKVRQPEPDVPSYQGHVFMLYGYYKDGFSTRRWIMWPFCNYSENYNLEDMRSNEERKEKNSSPRLERRFGSRSFSLFPFYTSRQSLIHECVKDKNDADKIIRTDYYKNISSYFLLVVTVDSPEKMASSFSFIGPFFNIENDDHGLKRLDILFIPFYKKAPPVNGEKQPPPEKPDTQYEAWIDCTK